MNVAQGERWWVQSRAPFSLDTHVGNDPIDSLSPGGRMECLFGSAVDGMVPSFLLVANVDGMTVPFFSFRMVSSSAKSRLIL